MRASPLASAVKLTVAPRADALSPEAALTDAPALVCSANQPAAVPELEAAFRRFKARQP